MDGEAPRGMESYKRRGILHDSATPTHPFHCTRSNKPSSSQSHLPRLNFPKLQSTPKKFIMLFKYLIGTVALAASVMSTPTLGGSSFVTIQKTSYQKCITTITEVKQPVVVSCKAGKVDKVKENLKKVYKPVVEVSTNFKSSVSIQKPVVVDQSKQFIQVLKKLEAVLIAIYKYPKISASCTDVFTELNVHFESICSQFKYHGVDIYKSIQESSLTFSVWTSLGFKFYHSK